MSAEPLLQSIKSKRSIIILILKSKDASWPENVENEQIFTSASKEKKKRKKKHKLLSQEQNIALTLIFGLRLD